MTDSMTKYNHRMTAEESVNNFIGYLEESNNVKLSDNKKEWLHNKGHEIFEIYYVDDTTRVNLVTEEDKAALLNYFSKVQEALGNMFAHIMLVEFKLYLLTNQE